MTKYQPHMHVTRANAPAALKRLRSVSSLAARAHAVKLPEVLLTA